MLLRKLMYLLLILILPGCIATEQQLFGDGLDLGEEFGFYTLNADDPEEGFLLVKGGQGNSYEMFGVEDGYTSVFVNRVFSDFLVLSGYTAESEAYHHLVLYQRGEQLFMLNDGENDLTDSLEQQKANLRKRFGYKDYAYAVRDRAQLEELVTEFAKAVQTGYFRESRVEIVRSDMPGNAERLANLKKRLENQ